MLHSMRWMKSPIADLSWSQEAPRRLPAGIGLSIAGGVSLLLWVLMVGLAQFF